MARKPGSNPQAIRNRAAKTAAVDGAAVARCAAGRPPRSDQPRAVRQEVRAEARKITWTSRQETWITSVMVAIMVVLAAVFFWLRRLAVCSFAHQPDPEAGDRRDKKEMSEAATATPSNPRHKWYIVHAYSNFEKKVAESIREQAKTQGLEENFSDILVPTEDVVEIRRGRKVNAERKFFPGYVLVKMELTDEAYHLIKNTPKVTGFLGCGSKPMPVSEKEVARIIGAIEEGVERPKPTIQFEIGEQVRVTDGPFASFNGSVEQVDEERARLRVTVSIFGRATPVELEYSQVEKTS